MMGFILDDRQVEKIYQEILAELKTLQNGVAVQLMKQRGIEYKENLGVSIVLLRELAARYNRNHLLVLKLWNKQWRETMILATMLEEPDKVTEEQMDYWTKTFESIEISEQAVMNLFPKIRFAFVKALEWCRGKKYVVKYTGLMLMGALAMTDKNALDEMFEPFFDVIAPLAKDKKLADVFYRSFGQLGRRNTGLNKMALEFAGQLAESENETARELGEELVAELSGEWEQKHLRS